MWSDGQTAILQQRGEAVCHELGVCMPRSSPPTVWFGRCLQSSPECCSSSSKPAAFIRLICNEATNNRTPTDFTGARTARWDFPRSRHKAGAQCTRSACRIGVRAPDSHSLTLLQPARNHTHRLPKSLCLSNVNAAPALCPVHTSISITIDLKHFFSPKLHH